MTPREAISILCICSAILFIIISILVSKRNKTAVNFFYASHDLGKEDFSITYIGANTTLTSIFIYLSAQSGISKLSIVFSVVFWMFGVVLFYKYSPALIESFKKGQTLHQYLAERYNSRGLQITASLATIFAFVGTVGLEFWGFAKFIEYFEISNESTIVIGLILIFIMAFYTSIGGYWATVKTDWLQVFIVILGCGFLISYFFNIKINGIAPDIAKMHRDSVVYNFNTHSLFNDPALIFAFGVVFIPFQFSVMDMWQRCVATGGKIDRFRKGALFSGIVVGAIFLIPIFIGFSEFSLDKGNEFPIFSALDSFKNPWIIATIGVMFLASVFSTADTLLIAATNSAIVDIFGQKNSKDLSIDVLKTKVDLFKCRSTVFVLSGASLFVFMAQYIGLSLSETIVAVFSSQSILGILVLYSIFFRNKAEIKGAGAMVAAAIGLAIPVPVVIFGKVVGDINIVNGAPVIAVCVAVLAFLIIPAKPEADRKR